MEEDNKNEEIEAEKIGQNTRASQNNEQREKVADNSINNQKEIIQDVRAESNINDSGELIEERKEKIITQIKKQFKSPYDFGALLVIIASALFRYYWLFKSKGQGLWFDEGSYIVMAKNWAIGTPAYTEAVRDYLVSLIWVPFIKLGIGDFGLRFLTVSVGIISFYFFYLLVSYFFGKKIGLISMILASVFSEHIFWSLRLDVGTYSICFMLISLVCFFKATEENKTLFYILAATFAVFSLQAHAAGIFVILLYMFYIPIQTRFKFYKSKKFWIFVFAFILILSLFFIRNIISFDQVYPRFQEGWFERGGKGDSFFESLIYVTTLSELIGKLSFYLFLIGLFISLDVFLIFDSFFKGKTSKENSGKLFFLLFGLISLALGIHSLMGPGGGIYEPRYIIPFYFSCLIFAALGINFIAKYIKKYSKVSAIIFIIIILLFISYTQLNKTSVLIDNKRHSYQGLKQAGEWLKVNSNPEDKIITFEPPQITYYSDRESIGMPNGDEETKKEIFESKPRFFIIWAGFGIEEVIRLTNLVAEYNESIIPRASFPQGAEQPTTIVYEIKNSLYKNLT